MNSQHADDARDRLTTEPIRRFLETARGAGLRISAAESIDVMRAVEAVGYGDRGLLKAALNLVIAKTPEEKIIYDQAFDLYFQREAFVWDGAKPGEGDVQSATSMPMQPAASATGSGGSTLGQMLEGADHAGITAAVEAAAEKTGLHNIRYFTQTGLYSLRILQQIGLRDLENQIDGLRRSGEAAAVIRGQRLAAQIDLLRDSVKRYVEQHLEMFGRADAEQFRVERLKAARLSNVSQRDMGHMRLLVRQMARKLASRYARVRRRRLRGQLDVRRTIRRNVGWGGVPFVTHWKQRKIEKPRVVVLCDVSGSVAEVSQFLLMFLYALNEALSDIHSFAFAGSMIDVSHQLEKQPVEQAIVSIMENIGYQSSNYGNALADFEGRWMRLLTPKTTVIIVGDARGNNADPRIDIFEQMANRSRRIIWLNPEHPGSWGSGDSDMFRYAPFCGLVRVCNTIQHLDRAISEMLEQQS